jgi:hypothetical protein
MTSQLQLAPVLTDPEKPGTAYGREVAAGASK